MLHSHDSDQEKPFSERSAGRLPMEHRHSKWLHVSIFLRFLRTAVKESDLSLIGPRSASAISDWHPQAPDAVQNGSVVAKKIRCFIKLIELHSTMKRV